LERISDFYPLPSCIFGEEIKPIFSFKEEYGYLKIVSDYQLVSERAGFPQIPVIRKLSVSKLFKVQVLKEESIKLYGKLIPIPKPVSKIEKFK